MLGARGIPVVTTQELPEGGVEKEERTNHMLIERLRICKEETSWVWNLEVGQQVWGYGMITASSKMRSEKPLVSFKRSACHLMN